MNQARIEKPTPLEPKIGKSPNIRASIDKPKARQPKIGEFPNIQNKITKPKQRLPQISVTDKNKPKKHNLTDSKKECQTHEIPKTANFDVTEEKESKKSKKKKSLQEVLQAIKKEILQNTSIFVINISRNETYLLAYEDEIGSFVKISHEQFRLFLNRKFPDSRDVGNLTRHNILELWDMLISEPSIQGNLDDFDKDSLHWNCKNFVLHWKKNKRLITAKHSPKYRFMSCLQGNILTQKDDISPERFLSVVKRNFPDAGMRKLFLQSFAYLLSWTGSSKVFFYFYGASNTGKTMFMNLLRRFVGSEFVSEIPIEKLSDRFSASYLSDKRVNICGEVENSTLKKSSFLKSIVGRDTQVAEFKGKDHFSFKPRVRLVFLANQMLQISSKIAEDALFNRIIFIEFLNPVPKNEQKPNLDEKLYEKEGDAILTYLALVYCDWLKNGQQFQNVERSEELKKEFMNQKEPVAQFIEDCCILNKDGKELTVDLYEAYEHFCADNCLDPLSRGKFSRELQTLAQHLNLKPKRFRKDGANPQYGYEGISIKHH